MNDEPKVPRRTFLDTLLKTGLIVWALSFIAPLTSYLWPVRRRGPGVQTVPVGKTADFPEWAAKIVAVNGQPVMVIHTAQGYRAFSAICTHLGCICVWDSQKRQIACPCHAGFFDVNGQVVSGPPPRPLAEFGVVIINNEVMVKSS